MDAGWLNSTAALIGAFAALLGSIAALLPQLRQKKKVKGEGATSRWPVVVGILLLVFSGSVIGVRLLSEKNEPMNVQLATSAWNSYNKGDYSAAISAADSCISHFRTSADKEEATLESSGVPVPPTGRTGMDEKQRILNRGLLNDTATCFFIIGESQSRLGRKNDAVDAYKAAAHYKYARVYDPSGDFFWSPSEVAEGRLNELQK